MRGPGLYISANLITANSHGEDGLFGASRSRNKQKFTNFIISLLPFLPSFEYDYNGL